MSTHKFAISTHLSGSLILLIVTTLFSLGVPAPVFAQTSETNDTEKARHAAGSYSVSQVPGDTPASNDQLVRLLREQNARLKAENAQLKAEIAKLKSEK